MKYSYKRKYKPGLVGWVIACTLMLAVSGCGGSGDSEPADAAPPPAPSGTNPGDPADPVDPALELSCSPTPAGGTVAPGGNVTATFKFNKSFNGTGVILAGITGDPVTPQNTAINGTQLVVNRTAPATGGYTIRLQLNGTGLSEACSWTVVFQAILIP